MERVRSFAAVSKPLLKFVDDKAVLDDEGVNLLRSLPGRIYPVIFMGDGRAGKSYLASRLLEVDEVFTSSDTAEPVTEGIDIVVKNVAPLAERCPGLGDLAVLDHDEPIHMVVLDCEGGNNAMAVIRTMVNVFGMIIGTEVVFVTGGIMSESAFQTLSMTLAARNLIKTDNDSELLEQRLVFIVNKNTLRYSENALEETLNQEQADEGRRESRTLVKETFSERTLIGVPMIGAKNFEDRVTQMRQKVLGDCRPLVMGGEDVTGEALCAVLGNIVEQMREQNEVSMPSMNRCVVLDGMLAPLRTTLIAEATNALSGFSDFDPNLERRDPRVHVFSCYDRQTRHIRAKQLVAEVRGELEERMNLLWESASQKNHAFGEQMRSTTTEQKEVLGVKETRPIGGGGMLRNVHLTYQEKRVLMRTVMVKKNGKTVESDWTECQGQAWKLTEDAFATLTSSIPHLQGKLLKKSPSVMKAILTAGQGTFQERICVVREGFIIWWDEKKVPMPVRTDSADEKRRKGKVQVQGCINFFLNQAQVIKDDDTTFRIAPRDEESGWHDASSFSGGKDRHITFQVGTKAALGHEFWPIGRWIEAIQANIAFAAKAVAQIGPHRATDEIGTGNPSLQEAIWRKPK